MKTALFFILAFLSVHYLSAQDTLYTTDGHAIGAKVTEITKNEIRYIKSSNPDGPVYVIPKSEVALIEYKNGSKDVFAKTNTKDDDDDVTASPNQQQTVIVNPRPAVNVVLGAWPMLAWGGFSGAWGGGWGWGGWNGWYRSPRYYSYHHHYGGHHGHYGRRGGGRH